MIVEDLITRLPVTVARTDSVAEAAWSMKENDVGSVIVVEAGAVVGILTDRDIALRLAAGDVLAETPVDKLMTLMPLCLRGSADIELCLEKMEAHGVRRIPVLDGRGELLGLVSLDDVLMHIGHMLGRAAALIRAEVAGVA